MKLIDNAQLEQVAGGDFSATLPEVVIVAPARPWWMPPPPLRFPWQQ